MSGGTPDFIFEMLMEGRCGDYSIVAWNEADQLLEITKGGISPHHLIDRGIPFAQRNSFFVPMAIAHTFASPKFGVNTEPPERTNPDDLARWSGVTLGNARGVTVFASDARQCSEFSFFANVWAVTDDRIAVGVIAPERPIRLLCADALERAVDAAGDGILFAQERDLAASLRTGELMRSTSLADEKGLVGPARMIRSAASVFGRGTANCHHPLQQLANATTRLNGGRISDGFKDEYEWQRRRFVELVLEDLAS